MRNHQHLDALRIGRLLRGIEATVGDDVVRQLAIARQCAVANSRTGRALRWPGHRSAVAACVVVMAVCAVVLARTFTAIELDRDEQFASQEVAMISDELPLTAYTDKGFSAYLAPSASNVQD